MTVTIDEYNKELHSIPKYRLTIRDDKIELTFKTDSYAQLYFMLNRIIKFPYYDVKEEKKFYNKEHELTVIKTTYYSEGGLF